MIAMTMVVVVLMNTWLHVTCLCAYTHVLTLCKHIGVVHMAVSHLFMCMNWSSHTKMLKFDQKIKNIKKTHQKTIKIKKMEVFERLRHTPLEAKKI